MKTTIFDDLWQELVNLPREEKPRQVKSYDKTCFEFEASRFYAPTGKKRTLKNGEERDETMPVPCLTCISDRPILGQTKFKIVANTRIAKIMRLTKIIRRACGNEDADKFLNAATKFLADCAALKAAREAKRNPQKITPAAKPRRAVGWNTPPSGKDCRRGAATASRCVPLVYRDSPKFL